MHGTARLITAVMVAGLATFAGAGTAFAGFGQDGPNTHGGCHSNGGGGVGANPNGTDGSSAGNGRTGNPDLSGPNGQGGVDANGNPISSGDHMPLCE